MSDKNNCHPGRKNIFNRLPENTIPVISAIILWALLSFTQQYYLRKTEDLSLFLFDWNFLLDSFKIPGGFLGWAGAFFTQFLYLPWLGALVWTAMLYLSWFLTVRIFNFPPTLKVIAALPAALLVIANMSLGYGMFIMRIQDYFFAPAVGYLIILGTVALLRSVKPLWAKLTLLAFLAFTEFFLFGCFGLFAVLAASIDAITSVHCAGLKLAQKSVITAWGVILVISVPLIMYGLFTSYKLTGSWSIGLPAISDDSWTLRIRLPYFIIAVSVLIFLLCQNLILKAHNCKCSHVAGQLVTAAVMASAIFFTWNRDPNFKAELAMSLAADRSDWGKMLDIYSNATKVSREKMSTLLEERTEKLNGLTDEYLINDILHKYDKKMPAPTRLMVVFRDLALLKQDKALDKAFAFADGGRAQKSPEQVPMAFQAAPSIYFHYGLTNMSYRWCLESQVEHGWNYCTLTYMARYAILMNETEFAYRYLNKLDKTLFHRKWAKGQRPLADDFEKMLVSMPYCETVPYMSFMDRMSNDHIKVESYLLSHFIKDRDDIASAEFDRATLLMAMRMQDIQLFWIALGQYLQTNRVEKLPQAVQEAIVLFSSLEKPPFQLPIDSSIENRYQAFQKFTRSVSAHNEKEADLIFRTKFEGTYFYYYYFVRGLSTF